MKFFRRRIQMDTSETIDETMVEDKTEEFVGETTEVEVTVHEVNTENLELIATYRFPDGGNLMVYADGGYAELSEIAEDGTHQVLEEGEYADILQAFCAFVTEDVEASTCDVSTEFEDVDIQQD